MEFVAVVSVGAGPVGNTSQARMRDGMKAAGKGPFIPRDTATSRLRLELHPCDSARSSTRARSRDEAPVPEPRDDEGTTAARARIPEVARVYSLASPYAQSARPQRHRSATRSGPGEEGGRARPQGEGGDPSHQRGGVPVRAPRAAGPRGGPPALLRPHPVPGPRRADPPGRVR